jgi:membrane fusion protein, multidrug efflux system
VAGKVQAIGEDGPQAGPQADGGGSPGGPIPLTVTVADQKALKALERGAVTVRHTLQEKKGVLTVPVPALLALAEGGYGLEVVDSVGTHILAVQVGMFADGRVEVSGNGIDAGITIRMPQ